MSAAYAESRAERYVQVAIERELAELENTQSDRNAALNRAAFALGQWVGADHLAEQEANDRLFAAAEANGYAKKDGRNAVRATIKSGLRKGMQEPRDPPRDESRKSEPYRPKATQRPANDQDVKAHADDLMRQLQEKAGAPTPRSLTRAELADSMKIPEDVLTVFGVTDAVYEGKPCVEIPYPRRDGTEARKRVRIALTGDRFRWKGKDGEIIAYEPDKGALAAAEGYVLIVEGESDTITLNYAGIPALGIPGSNLTHTIEAHHVEGLSRVFVVQEPDKGGAALVAGVRERLGELGFAGELHVLTMPDGAKDASELWKCAPEQSAFTNKLNEAMRKASEPPKPAYKLLSESITEQLKPIGQRLKTGFPALDEATRGGIPLGRLIATLGAPGAGKTSFCVQLADTFEQQGCAVVYLASDEPAEGIVTRLGQLAGFSRDALEEDGAIGDSVRAGFAKRAEGRSLAVVDPDADESMRSIEDAAEALDHLAGDRPRVLIVDSLQTAQCRAAESAESIRERIDAKMSILKAIAKRGVLVFVISEMARSGYRTGDRNTDVSALAAGKESGGIEYGVALLLGLRSVKGEQGQVDVEVAKNRLGGTKPEFRLQLDFDRASFAEIEMPDAEERAEVKADARMNAAKERVRKAVRAHRNLESQRDILAKCDGSRSANHDAIREMVKLRELEQVDGVFRLQAERDG